MHVARLLATGKIKLDDTQIPAASRPGYLRGTIVARLLATGIEVVSSWLPEERPAQTLQLK